MMIIINKVINNTIMINIISDISTIMIMIVVIIILMFTTYSIFKLLQTGEITDV